MHGDLYRHSLLISELALCDTFFLSRFSFSHSHLVSRHSTKHPNTLASSLSHSALGSSTNICTIIEQLGLPLLPLALGLIVVTYVPPPCHYMPRASSPQWTPPYSWSYPCLSLTHLHMHTVIYFLLSDPVLSCVVIVSCSCTLEIYCIIYPDPRPQMDWVWRFLIMTTRLVVYCVTYPDGTE